MTITFITPPGQGGVRDYADKLIENLGAEQAATAFVWHQDPVNAIAEVALSSNRAEYIGCYNVHYINFLIKTAL